MGKDIFFIFDIISQNYSFAYLRIMLNLHEQSKDKKKSPVQLHESSAAPHRASFSCCQVSELVLLLSSESFTQRVYCLPLALGDKAQGKQPPHRRTQKGLEWAQLVERFC